MNTNKKQSNRLMRHFSVHSLQYLLLLITNILLIISVAAVSYFYVKSNRGDGAIKQVGRDVSKRDEE